MRILLLYAALIMGIVAVKAQDKFVDRSTDVLCLAPTLTGLCMAIVEEDKKGALELGLGTATTLAVNYALESAIRKGRPDGSGKHAFPSTHAAVSFSGSSFLMRRYGWKWGVPAYAVSAYVAWGRTYTKKHDWWDVIGGAMIGAGAAFLYTRPLVKDSDLTVSPALLDGEAKGITASISF